jgi:hypothetical protein
LNYESGIGRYLFLALLFLALAFFLAFLPDLHPHVLHILGPFTSGPQLAPGPKDYSLGDSCIYRLHGRMSINNFEGRWDSRGTRKAEMNFRLTSAE